jgi:hypothetical protein
MALVQQTFNEEFLVRWNATGLQGAHVIAVSQIIDDATGLVVPGTGHRLDPRPIVLSDSAALSPISSEINTAALADNAAKDIALKAATEAQAAAEAARDAALAEAATLTAQLAALQPVINGVPQFVKKWQLLAGLRMDNIYTPVMAFINALPPAALDLWSGSAGVERDSPFLVPFKSQFGKTDADLDSMFTRYSAITQADVLALA